MNELFEREFKKRDPKNEFTLEDRIPYASGGFYQPTPRERIALGLFLAGARVKPASFLLLPTQTVRMRRFLSNLRQRSPVDARNLVVLNGDSISFHSVYRDREVMWNIVDVPYSLVFFAHRNPIDHAAGFAWEKPKDEPASAFPQHGPTGTHDILLYRDVFAAFLYAAFDNGQLLGDALQVRQRLQATCWYDPPAARRAAEPARVRNPHVHTLEPTPPRFFDAAGNRQSQTGEHIVWVKPSFTEDRVDLVSKISVWAMRPDEHGGAWHLLEAQNVLYSQSRAEDLP
jgi:hypothetical protein